LGWNWAAIIRRREPPAATPRGRFGLALVSLEEVLKHLPAIGHATFGGGLLAGRVGTPKENPPRPANVDTVTSEGRTHQALCGKNSADSGK